MKIFGWRRTKAHTEDTFERHVQARLDAQMHDGYALAKRYGDALIAIAEMETPKANAKVRRMANVAREALK